MPGSGSLSIFANRVTTLTAGAKAELAGLMRVGQVTTATSSTVFQSTDLIGQGDDAFDGWFVSVLQADNAAPESELKPMSDYVSATGRVTHTAFTAQLAVGDWVVLLRPEIAMLGAVDTAAATGAVTSTDLLMAYMKQRVTQGVAHRTYKSTLEHIVAIPGTGADLTFPSVVVSGLPTGATLISVELALTIGSIFDTSAAENQIKTGTTDSLWIKASGGAWGTDDIEALVFKALSLQTASGAYRSGTTIWGTIDVKSEVTGNGTYNIASRETTRTKGVEATGGSLELHDVTTILDVWWS